MKKFLSSNDLKLISILAMLLDHIAYLFLSVTSMLYFVFRIIGRVSAPIMFMGIANGYKYTRDKIKYGGRLLSFAFISQIPYSLFIDNKFFMFDNYNVLFSLFLGFLSLCILYGVKDIGLKILFFVFLLMASYFCDYGILAICLILVFSLFKDNKIKMLFYSLICSFYLILETVVSGSIVIFIILLGLFLVIPLFNLYNGEKGKYNLKYLFYAFYPIHLLVLFMLNLLFY